MANNTAYLVLKDVSLPRPIFANSIGTLASGEELYETAGATYAEGDYVLEEELTPRDRERAANGELDQFLEEVDASEVEEVRERVYFERNYHTRTAEHEAEAVVMEQYGHEVVPRSELLEAKSAGADDVKEAVEAAKEEGDDERPGLTSPPTPDLATASREGTTITPDVKEEHKASPRRARKAPKSQERPSGAPTGKDKEDGEGK